MKQILVFSVLSLLFSLQACTILGFEASSSETSTTNVDNKDLNERVTDLEKRVKALEEKY
jgi:hypothetical protein